MTRLLLLLCFSVLYPSTCVRAQEETPAGKAYEEQELSASYQERLLTDIIPELEQHFGLTFSYLESAVANKRITHEFKRAKWHEIVDFIFQRSGIELKLVDGGFAVLTPMPPDKPRNWDVCVRLLDETGAALPFVTAALAQNGESAYTDNDGWCRRTFRGAATDSIVFQFLGYQPLRLALADAADGSCPAINLLPTGIDLASVEVVEYLTRGIETTIESRRITIRPDEVETLPGFTENEPYRAVQLLPGVNSSDETAGSLNIRGGARDQTQILWDGINIYAPGHYLGMISFFSPELIDEINVWRGQADASYGGRLSGVVRLDTDRGIVGKPEAGGGVNLTHGNAYLKVPLIPGKSDLHLSGRTSIEALLDGPTYQSYQRQFFQGSTAESLLDPEDEDEFLQDSTFGERTFLFREFNGRWQWNPTTNTNITLSGFTQRDQFDFDIEFSDDDSDEIEQFYVERFLQENAGASINVKHHLPRNRQLEAQLTYSDFSSFGSADITLDNDEEDLRFLDERSSRLQDAAVQLTYQQQLENGHGLRAGFQYQNLNSSYREFELTSLFLEQEFEEEKEEEIIGNSLVAFGAYQFRPQGPFRADLGLRLQNYSLTQQVYAEPRLTASYRVNSQVHLKAGYGQNHQFFSEVIEVSDLSELAPPSSLWVLAEGDELDVASARELTLGGILQQRGWLVDLEFYRKTSDNLPALNPGGIPSEMESLFTLGRSRNLGLDLLVKKRWKNFRSWVIYTLSSSKLQYDEFGEEFFPAVTDRPHRFRWVNTYSADRWLLSLGWQLNSGARYTENTAFFDPFTEEQSEIAGPTNAERLENFSRLDCSAFYRWGAKGQQRGVRGKIGFSILNVLNRKNPTARSFRIDQFNASMPASNLQELNKFGLRFTPNLSFSMEWR